MIKLRDFFKRIGIPMGAKETASPTLESLLKSPEEVYAHSSEFYSKSDLIYFEKINAYAAFKYNIVKDILMNRGAIGVSDVHLDLNGVYFSLDEKKHQHNKKAAVKHLTFLSKGLRNSENEFTHYLCSYFCSKFPKDLPFNLVDYLINPLVFINIMEEYGFLEYFPEFNPESPDFIHETAIEKIKAIFENSEVIEPMLKSYLDKGGQVPETMQHLTDEINIDKDITPEQLPRFFASMIFAATHSTSSFLSSLVHVVHRQYPELLTENPNKEKQYSIINEVLRIYTPVPFIYRTVRRDTVYAGKNLKAGDTVILYIGAANLDPKYFPEPHQIMVNRDEKHLAFGRGQYACIGQFATFRLAVNFLSYLTETKHQFAFIDTGEQHSLHNAMLKIPIHVVLNE